MEQNQNKNPMPPIWSGTDLSDSERFDGHRRSQAMFRWWIPGGFVSRAELEREIKTVAEHGFRGLEICINMADTKYTREERAQYGWGTPHWRETLRFILQTANRYGLQIDITISPGWPAGIPGITPEDDCAAKELNICSSAPFSGSFTGSVPAEPDHGLVNSNQPAPPAPPAEEEEVQPQNRPILLAVTAAKISAVRQVPMTGGRFGPPTADPDAPLTDAYLLDPDSLQIVPFKDAGDGTYSVDFSCPDQGQWLIFGHWMRGSQQTNRQGSATELPCYAVDHFNRIGAEAVMNYWEENILDEDLRAQLRENGGVIFEDSIELDISDYATHWSRHQLEKFHELRGYDMTPYLPLLVGFTYMDPKNYKYELADKEGAVSSLGQKFRNDYCQFLTEIYQSEHIRPIQNWAASLGLGYRSQGYGIPFDLTAIAACSHGPEGESLGFGDGIRSDDRFRTISGGAHMGQRPVISDEMGAVAGEGYRWTWQSMLKWIDKNIAGGANLILFHGLPYAVSNTSRWPGYSPFGFGLAGQWGPRQPEWEFIDDLSRYLSRTQAIVQSGVPRVDVAILKVYYEGFNFSGLLPDQSLYHAGYTYDFITPNTLALDTSVVDGVLSPQGPGYRAMILCDELYMQPSVLEQLILMTKQGFKIVLCGELPSASPFLRDDQEDEKVPELVQHLLSDSVHVKYVMHPSELPAALDALGVQPALAPERPIDLMSVRRCSGNTDYYYLHNRTSEGPIALSLVGTGAVYELDSWNGNILELPTEQKKGRSTVWLNLCPEETRLLALAHGRPSGASQRIFSDAISISDGWSLTVERWEEDPNGADSTATKKTLLPIGPTKLLPWSEISGLGWEASGIGTYNNTITLEENWPAAEIAFQDVRCQSVHLYINGIKIPVNHHTMRAVAGNVFRKGENTVTVKIVTTLGNQLIADGAFPQMPWMEQSEEPVEFGLCGSVLLRKIYTISSSEINSK